MEKRGLEKSEKKDRALGPSLKTTGGTLSARLLAVANSIEAMSSDRPYRLAMTREEIIATQKEEAGSQWDPQVSEAALRVLCRKGDI